MKNFHIFCYVSIIILSYVVSMVESLFPVDLVRVVLGMPATPVVNTPSLAWFVVIASYTVIGISMWIGLPRVPPPKPLRRRSTFDASLQQNFGIDHGAVVDMMAEMDISDCFARYLCQVGTQTPEETTFVQKILSDLVRDIMGPGLRLQPKASQKKVQSKSSVAWKWWTHPETLVLIDVWGEAMEEHCKTYKGKRILPLSAYEKIAERLGQNGVRRSVEQIREKIKTLKKSFWGALAKSGGAGATGRVNGKRQSVIEKMRRVLQANGNIVKGKYTWKSDSNGAQTSAANSRAKVPRKSKRGKKVYEVVEKDEEYEEEDEVDGEETQNQLDVVPVQEINGDSGDEEMPMGITVEPDHVHGPAEHWAEMNGGGHMGNDGGGGSGGSGVSGGGGEITYDYPLCQVIENMMNKFLGAQRESEERFLVLEEQRMKAESKRWELLQKRDTEVVNKLLQAHDRWRKEDREQELRMWAALASKVGGGSTHHRSNSKSEATPELSQFMFTPPPPVQWQFAGTFRPSVATDAVPSSSQTLD